MTGVGRFEISTMNPMFGVYYIPIVGLYLSILYPSISMTAPQELRMRQHIKAQAARYVCQFRLL